jgi:hypothetical protein
VTWGETALKATTGFSGFADLKITKDAIGDDITVKVTAEGYEPQEYTTSFTAEGVLAQQPSPMVASEVIEPPDKDPEGPSGWEYGIIVVLLILVLLALMMFLGKPPSISWRKEEEAKGKEDT